MAPLASVECVLGRMPRLGAPPGGLGPGHMVCMCTLSATTAICLEWSVVTIAGLPRPQKGPQHNLHPHRLHWGRQ